MSLKSSQINGGGHPWKIYGLISLMGLLVVGMIVYSLSLGLKAGREFSPLVDAVMEIKLETTTAHLWFEEVLAGDRHEDIEQVWKHLDEAEWYACAMLEGGRNQEGTYIPLKDELLRNQIEQVRQKISNFKKISGKRYSAVKTSGVGTEIDQKYDRVFEDFIAQADRVESMLQQHISKKLTTFQVLQTVLIAVCIFLCFVICFVIFKFISRQNQDMMEVRAANQQLDASNQQLSANEQQLKAANQQLAANEQQLRASNQQLAANEQQLRAANQQLEASQQELNLSSQKYQSLFDNMLDAFALHEIILDENGNPCDYRFLDANPAFEKMTGLKVKEIIGKTVLEVIPGLEKHWIETYGKVALTGKHIRFENYTEPLEKYYDVIAFQPAERQFACIFMDITDRKETQKKEEERQVSLLKMEKMASLGTLVSGVAHEINNPNNFMLLNSGLFSKVWDDITPILDDYMKTRHEFLIAGMEYSEARGQIKELIDGFHYGADRIKRIVEALKDYARQDLGESNSMVDINKVIETSMIIAGNVIKKSTDNFKFESGDIRTFSGNPQQLEQVMINLLTNSCHALKNRKKAVRISTTMNESEDKVIVKVQDEGVGISEANLGHIKDPFFTTKRDSGGTGLGLSISYNIVQNHNGTIEVNSKEGKGTTFTISLPTARE